MTDILMASASSHDDGNEYKLLRMIHAMAGQAACAKVGSWQLGKTATYPGDYVLTTWTNGVVEVGAETTTLESGDVTHDYWICPVTKEGESQ